MAPARAGWARAMILYRNRSLGHLLAIGMVTVTLALACGHCLAFLDEPNPVPGSHGDCHSGAGDVPDPVDACECGSAAQAQAAVSKWTSPVLTHLDAEVPPVLQPVPADPPGMRLAATGPSRDTVLPPLSPLRRFCIQLE